MNLTKLTDNLWGSKGRFLYLLCASGILLFTMLGAKEIWTQEHRWADIVYGMFYRHDFFHPYLGENAYYDKPLLSYWLIAGLAKLTGTLNTWTLRLPSAFAGLLAVCSIYQLGKTLKDKQLGLVSGWLLLTTFYFLFWARVASADILNLAGSLLAVAWYMAKRTQPNFFNYAIFFIIVAMTSLCKGLIGACVPLIAVFIDMVLCKTLRKHLRLTLLISIMPAMAIYLLPFLASSYFNAAAENQNGLYLVYKENFLRYFEPFDHRGPIYTYLIYLPIYLAPWAVFFIPALFAAFSRWKTMTLNSKWICLTLLCLFVFFTLSGSRRSYYVLPMVPFGILLTADWILAAANTFSKRYIWSASFAAAFFVLLFLSVDIFSGLYYARFGIHRFAESLQIEANKIQPWRNWNIVILDAESKLNFYLKLPPNVKEYGIEGPRETQTVASVLACWPVLKSPPKNTIFISRKLYKPLIKDFFTGYRLVELPETSITLFKSHDVNLPIAFIPNN